MDNSYNLEKFFKAELFNSYKSFIKSKLVFDSINKSFVGTALCNDLFLKIEESLINIDEIYNSKLGK